MSATFPAPTVRFAHDSERRLAELLDFYGIAWVYEPVEFVLAWDERGRPRSAFRPDFYLPEHELFIELTTLRQSLVTRKNRKLRQLRELHPELNVRILYRQDYLDLIQAPEAFLREDATFEPLLQRKSA